MATSRAYGRPGGTFSPEREAASARPVRRNTPDEKKTFRKCVFLGMLLWFQITKDSPYETIKDSRSYRRRCHQLFSRWLCGPRRLQLSERYRHLDAVLYGLPEWRLL